MANHNHNMFGGHHICMWEGPSYTPSALEINHNNLKAQMESNTQELQRLRKLLDDNNIPWAKSVAEDKMSKLKTLLQTSHRQTSLFTWARSSATKQSSSAKQLPHLPNEILLRILKATVTLENPIIDPFWKCAPENMTDIEQSRKVKRLSLGFLSSCKSFRNEGISLLIASNQFIFTQVEALQNFCNFSPAARASIEHVTLRIVAKYYDKTAYKKVLRGNTAYHAVLESPTVWVKARPSEGSLKKSLKLITSDSLSDKGIQSYSWQQMTDFMQCFVLRTPPKGRRQLLFSHLKTMRIDLVNFSDHIPFLGSPFVSILRWHIGSLVDELTVTGLIEEDMSNGEVRYMQNLVRRNGIFALGAPAFASAKIDRLRPLKGYELDLQLVNPTSPLPPVPSYAEAGDHPKSIYPDGWTTWRYTSDSLSDPRKKWVEFHGKCGLQVDNCAELQSILEEMKEDIEALSSSPANGSTSDTQTLEDSWEEDGDSDLE